MNISINTSFTGQYWATSLTYFDRGLVKTLKPQGYDYEDAINLNYKETIDKSIHYLKQKCYLLIQEL